MDNLTNFGDFNKETIIKNHVYSVVSSFAERFKSRHIGQVDDPNGIINMKIHNGFIAALSKEIQYYTALVRSLDSSLGNMLEKLAINIAKNFYKVEKRVIGPLYKEQTKQIAYLLEQYKRRIKTPQVDDYQILRKSQEGETETRRHESDYYLIDGKTGEHNLIELKIGGDLDNKKARAEKEAILEQFAILSNTLSPEKKIKIYFATAYNRYGEDRPWKQERVRQFFADDELLIGKDFWNFICKDNNGYDIVLEAYKDKANLILDACEDIKDTYLE